MKILLFGKNGQVGGELQHRFASLGELIAMGTDSRDMCGDLADLNGIAQTVHAVRPDVIVNAAAYTAVDKAESEPELAYLINTQAPGVLAQEAKKLGAWLVHYSTDYVFDGSGDKPWLESDAPNPLNVYGATKLDGEQAIQASGCNHLIFRTSWVYAARGNNFVKTMLRMAKERDSLTVINDQIGAPTGANLIADVTANALCIALKQPEVGGLYHLAAEGETSWYDYARFILDFARRFGVDIRVAPNAVIPISSRDFPTAAKRPHNSRLNKGELKHIFSLRLPDWRIGVEEVLAEILR